MNTHEDAALGDNGIDQMLKSYFRHEMPARFPAAPGTSAPVPTSGSWSLMSSRFIIGASLVALMLAYMGLAAFFPTSTSNLLNPNSTPHIGQKTGIPKTVTP